MLAVLGPLSALLGTEAALLKDRAKRQLVLWGSLAALGAIAVVFTLVAINAALTYAVGPVVAPLIVAGTSLLIALLILAVFHFRAAREEREEAEKKRTSEVTALVTTAAITAAPVLLPLLRKVALPAGGLAAATYALVRARTARREE